MSASSFPVITIDGPTASGKGTVAHRVAERLGFHYLDSGALYRLTALSALRSGTPLTDEHALSKLASGLHCSFSGDNDRPARAKPRPKHPPLPERSPRASHRPSQKATIGSSSRPR